MKLTTVLRQAFLVGAFLLNSSHGFADVDSRFEGRFNSRPMITERLDNSYFYVNSGETHSLYIPGGWRGVQKIFVQAEGYNSSDSTFEVITNGDVKGTIHVPGRDPSYVVTIGESINSIQFRHIGGGTATIREVRVVMTEECYPQQYEWENRTLDCRKFNNCNVGRGVELPARNQSMYLARRAIQLVDTLEGYTNYKDYGAYLLPIKKAAGLAWATASAKGDLSLDVRMALLTLKRQVEEAKCYLDETFERSNAFEVAVELASLGEKLDAVLR